MLDMDVAKLYHCLIWNLNTIEGIVGNYKTIDLVPIWVRLRLLSRCNVHKKISLIQSKNYSLRYVII